MAGFCVGPEIAIVTLLRGSYPVALMTTGVPSPRFVGLAEAACAEQDDGGGVGDGSRWEIGAAGSASAG
jgi:hypothetical protein